MQLAMYQTPNGGSYSLHIQPQGPAFTQNFLCAAGTFTVSGSYKMDAGTSAYVTAVVGPTSQSVPTLKPVSSWTKFNYSFQASSCGFSYLQIGGGHAGATGTVWFDDISVTTTGNAVSNLISNPGFETVVSPSWTMNSNARPSYVRANGGQVSMLTGQNGQATQNVTGRDSQHVVYGYGMVLLKCRHGYA